MKVQVVLYVGFYLTKMSISLFSLRDIKDLIVAVLRHYQRYRNIPEAAFFRELEKRYGKRLSRYNKQEILNYLSANGRILRTRYGGRIYITTQPVA